MNIFKSKGLFLSLGLLISGVGIYGKTTDEIKLEQDNIRRQIVSIHTLAFGKDNLFTDIKSKDIESFTQKELGKWNTLINEIGTYITSNAFNNQTILTALNTCFTASNMMTNTLRYYYPPKISISKVPEKTILEKLSLIKPQIDALEKTRTALNAAETELKKEKFTGFFVENKAEKQAAYTVLTTLITFLDTTIAKIIKDYNSLAPQQQPEAKPAAAPRPVGPQQEHVENVKPQAPTAPKPMR